MEGGTLSAFAMAHRNLLFLLLHTYMCINREYCLPGRSSEDWRRGFDPGNPRIHITISLFLIMLVHIET